MTSFYENLNLQLEGLITSVPHLIANLANAAALLYESLEDINWAGFYLMEKDCREQACREGTCGEEEYPGMSPENSDIREETKEKSYTEKEILVLGPFQGKPACIEIPIGKGVCGRAVQEDCLQLVKNVHEFPGHIACDSASNSEIVIPIYKEGRIFGVLDIDSPKFARFTEEDADGLCAFVRILEKTI